MWLWGRYMCIYCRWREIVFALRIYRITPAHIWPVDGPQLEWERIAIRPPSGRCHPRAARPSARAHTFLCGRTPTRPFCASASPTVVFVRALGSVVVVPSAVCLVALPSAPVGPGRPCVHRGVRTLHWVRGSRYRRHPRHRARGKATVNGRPFVCNWLIN